MQTNEDGIPEDLEISPEVEERFRAKYLAYTRTLNKTEGFKLSENDIHLATDVFLKALTHAFAMKAARRRAN